MTRVLPNIKPNVAWYEGMMLTPQHFQQYDKYLSTLSEFMLASLGKSNWGLLGLEIDVADLANGEFKIGSCQAIFRDGVFFDSNSLSSGNLSLNLNEHIDLFRDKPQIIVIRLPKEVRAEFTSEDSRFLSDKFTQDSDENIAHNTTSIQRKVPNVGLALASNSNDKYSQLEIAEVSFSGGVFEFTDYHPPAMQLLTKFNLSHKLRSLAKEVREKAIFVSDQAIADRRSSRGGGVTRTELNLQALCGGLPELENVIANDAHPNEIYKVLCRLSGDLSVMNDNSVPPNGGKYVHNDLVKAMKPHFNYISAAIAKISKNYKLLEMEPTNLGFKLNMDEFEFGKSVKIIFEKYNDERDSEVTSWLSECLIAGAANIEDLRKKRTLGVARRVLQGADREKLLVGTNYEVIEVDIESGVLDRDDFMEIRSSTSDDDRAPDVLYVFSVVE